MNANAFFDLVRDGNLYAAKQALEENPKLGEQRDPRGSTPLILAAYYNHHELVHYLLSLGVAVDATDASGNTALMGACFKGHTESAKVLI